MIYETVIVPGERLGNSIKLGSSLYETITHLNKFNYKLRVNYSEKQFLHLPIVVTIVDFGIRLTFRNNSEQVLDLIEVLDVTNQRKGRQQRKHRLLKLVYNGIGLNEFESDDCDTTLFPDEQLCLSETSSTSTSLDDVSTTTTTNSHTSSTEPFSSSGPTLKLIYNKIFGPTYPGKISLHSPIYILSYPGVSFRFNILNDLLYKSVLEETKKNDGGSNKNDELVLSILLNWDSPRDISCEAIALYKGNSWDDFNLRELLPLGSEANTNEYNSQEPVKEPNLKVNLDDGTVKVYLKESRDENGLEKTIKPFVIKLGETTQQEISNILGPPDDYFNKFDSRLLIHNHLPKLSGNSKNDQDAGNDISHYKFHNYFRFGIDFLYDLSGKDYTPNNCQQSSTVKKVILHNGGITESLNFMKWNKCNWEIQTTIQGTTHNFNSSMYFCQLPQQFQELTPVLLNRNESEFIDNDLDIIDFPQQTSLENITNNDIPEKVKTWGQSKLYGFERCIFEVIDSNGCISTVTIY